MRLATGDDSALITVHEVVGHFSRDSADQLIVVHSVQDACRVTFQDIHVDRCEVEDLLRHVWLVNICLDFEGYLLIQEQGHRLGVLNTAKGLVLGLADLCVLAVHESSKVDVMERSGGAMVCVQLVAHFQGVEQVLLAEGVPQIHDSLLLGEVPFLKGGPVVHKTLEQTSLVLGHMLDEKVFQWQVFACLSLVCLQF